MCEADSLCSHPCAQKSPAIGSCVSRRTVSASRRRPTAPSTSGTWVLAFRLGVHESADLAIEDHQPAAPKVEAAGRDKGGGFDPCNQRGSGKREGEAAQRAGDTGAPNRDRSMLDKLLGKK